MLPKTVLAADRVDSRPQDYYDERKQLYGAVPVFPFLSYEAVQAAVQQHIDTAALAREVAAATARYDTIAGTDYVICLTGWVEYPELIKLLTITREFSFRNDGGGVGSVDYDEFDPLPEMQQLIILNPDYDPAHPVSCIMGGYRFVIHEGDSYGRGPMGDHFVFRDTWQASSWIELGRSFMNPYYQQDRQRQTFDLILHGLGYIYATHPDTVGFFGKVTLYQLYEAQGADAFLLGVARHYFRKSKGVQVRPEERVPEGDLTEAQREVLDRNIFKGMFALLRRDYQVNMVKIMAIYNRMTHLSNMYYFGAFRHAAFGDTTEMGIAIHGSDFYEVVKEKFIYPYGREHERQPV